MRHKSGQIQQNSHQSDSNFSNPKAPFSSVPPLTDANYEFLFNQLLEGVAHGWHPKRIVKFFDRLGIRGKQADWVSWLERFKSKISGTYSVSIERMANLMVRLGELAQSTPEIQQIGTISYQIGRQVLLSNTKNVIWEYNGADFQPDVASAASPISTETKSDELPKLNSNLTREANSSLSPDIELNASEVPISDNLDISPQEEESKLNHNANDILSSSEVVIDSKSNLPDLNTNSPLELENLNSSDAADNLSDEPDLQELIPIVQTNEKVVRQISKKLNIPDTDSIQSNHSDTARAVNKSLHLLQQKFNQPQTDGLNGQSPQQNSTMELVETWFNLGLKQVSIGDFDGAIHSWEKALSLNPNLSEAWHNRGSALGRLSRYEEAIESFGRSLLVAPNNYQAWNDRAHALYQLQKWQEASESWEKAIEIMPGNHLFWYNRGCALEQLNNLNESIASYEKALEIKPDFQPARSRYINLIADNSTSN